MRICAGIPAYNEETSIGSVVLKTRKHADRVFVVDDGSIDRTAEIAELAGAKVIKHEQNGGYGAAVRTCFEEARRTDANVLIILDADGQHDPDYLPQLTSPILLGEADIVIGSRFLTDWDNIPRYRVFGMKVLDQLTNLAGQKTYNVSDTQSGYRAYSKKAYSGIDLTENGMGVGSEILLKAEEKNLRIKEVPINVRYDVGKHSSNPVTHGIHVITAIVRTISQRRPLLFFGSTGTALLLGGLLMGLHVVGMFNQSGSLPVGNALVTVLLTISGLFIILTGVILYAIEDSVRRAIGKSK